MTKPLDTSNELNGRDRDGSHTAFSSSLVDADGVRCEVRSMRSVPHALYTLPSVSRVVAGYVRQLLDDFTTSLLLCRPTRRRVYGLPNEGNDNNSTAGSRERKSRPADVVTGASLDEEEAYLLLRLCVLEARQRRQRRRATQQSGNGHEGKAGMKLGTALNTTTTTLLGQLNGGGGAQDGSGSDDDGDSATGWLLGGKPRDAPHLSPRLTTVDEQLLEMFANAEETRREGGETAFRGPSVTASVAAMLHTTPPLLSSLLRFKPLLRDMQFIARHVLLPRYAWPHHQREWVNVCEDVSVTVCDRLARYRKVLRGGTEEEEEEGSEARTQHITIMLTRRVVPAAEVEALWHTLWELLGAAWRQRDRLWGSYRYVQGPRQLPPLSLNGQAAAAIPPGVHASPILRDQHLRHLVRTATLDNSGGGASAASSLPQMPPSVVAAHDEDSCAFGPFTSGDVGVSAGAAFVLRQPASAALRLLRVCVPAAGRDALATSTTAFAGFKYVSEPARRTASSVASPAPPGNGGGSGGNAAAAAPAPRGAVVVPLFDPTEEDVRLRRAVPYLAPEVYVAQQLQPPVAASAGAPVHRFSDDVWNAAVVVLEAALCSFAVLDPTQCHLSSSVQRRRGGAAADREASPDAVPPKRSAAGPAVTTDSVYGDVLFVLATRHAMSETAAHNFLYAALHHLHRGLKALLIDSSNTEVFVEGGRHDDGENESPSPAVLAREWVRYLRTHYSADFVLHILAGEVATRGLCWRRSERWNAFGMAHIAATATNTAASLPPRVDIGSSPLVASPLSFGSASSEGPTSSGVRGRDGASGVAHDAGGSPTAALVRGNAEEEAESYSPLHCPTAGPAGRPIRLRAVSSTSTATTLARLPQRLDRAVNAMDTPLMPLFGAPACGGGGGVVGDSVWERLTRFLQRRTALAGKQQSAQQSSNSANGGVGGRANGAVADAADVDAVEEFLHLLYTCIGLAMRSNHDDDSGKDGGGSTRYAAVNHPFLRGVAERGVLTTYMTVCGCARDALGQRQTYEASLQLYAPTRVLLASMDQLEAAYLNTTALGSSSVKNSLLRRDARARMASAADVTDSLERLVKRTGTLRTFIGDNVRAWEAARDASRRTRAAYPTHFDYAAVMQEPPAAVHRARHAVEAVMTPMDASVPLQLHHVTALQRLCLYTQGGDPSLSGGGAAPQVRRYLRTTFLPTSSEQASSSNCVSPFLAIPPTLRGALWGCLLHVPSARKREAIYTNAIQRTAAKPSLNDRQLAVDIPRCHAYHPLLASARGSAQLQRLLRAWLFVHPRFAYWQGLDSVCAVLLTVSPHDEALVLAQLSAVVEQFIAHDEGGEEGMGSRSSLLQSPSAAQQQQQQMLVKPSMSDQLHRLTVVLRYCDPLLAHYLFQVLGCTPELYAISWLLTVFSHSLPTRKVYLLWDLLFTYGGGSGVGGGGATCLVALCAAVIMHRRVRLLSTDFTGCLSAFGSGAAHLDVAAAVGDTRQLMAALPPSILAQPCAEEERRLYASSASPSAGRASSTAAQSTQLPCLAVEDLKSAWAADKSSPHWSDSGVYIVDIRPDASGDALLGAIHLPLQTPTATTTANSSSAVTPPASQLVDSFASDAAERVARGESSRNRRGAGQWREEDDSGGAGEGWGIVADQERQHERQQLAREAQERHVADAAAELVRHLGNPSVAAIAPRAAKTANGVSSDGYAVTGADGAPRWPVHPIVLKTCMAPHVVLVASGSVSYNSTGSPSSPSAVDGEDVSLAHLLGLRLNACGVHNVSVLRGGAVAIRFSMPELVVPHSQGV